MSRFIACIVQIRLIEEWQCPQRLGNTYRRAIVSGFRAVLGAVTVVVRLVVVHCHQSA